MKIPFENETGMDRKAENIEIDLDLDIPFLFNGKCVLFSILFSLLVHAHFSIPKSLWGIWSIRKGYEGIGKKGRSEAIVDEDFILQDSNT